MAKVGRKPNMNMAYICCSNDRYELPIYVTRTAEEMAGKLGITEQSVTGMVKRVNRGAKIRLDYKIYKIKVKKDFWSEE